MIIRIDETLTTAVEESQDLSSLKLLVAEAVSLGDAATALGPLGTLDGPAHARLSVSALRNAAELRGDAAWAQRYEKMIDYAVKQGWADAGRTDVRVHLERGTS